MSRRDPLPRLSALAAPELSKREREGLLVAAPDDFNCRFDPRGEDVRPVDFGDTGEDKSGIWVRRHPEAILLDEAPDLLAVLDRFQAGQTSLTPADWDELSAPEYDAKLELADALERNTARAWESAAENNRRRGGRS